jgi:hypothetical protein
MNCYLEISGILKEIMHFKLDKVDLKYVRIEFRCLTTMNF